MTPATHHPQKPDKPRDPETGIWRRQDWGPETQRGFVRNARFTGPQSTERVIPGTNRATTKKWRALDNKKETPRP